MNIAIKTLFFKEEKMQKNVPVNPPPLLLNPIKDAVGVSAVDYSADFDPLFKKSENLKKIFEMGKASDELVRYLPGLTKPLYQGQLKGTTERKAFADDTFKDLKVAEYTIQLSNNAYMNFHNVHLILNASVTMFQFYQQPIQFQFIDILIDY